MRKVLSFVLVLTLVLSSFSMAFAATPSGANLSDIAGNANVDAIQVAYDLSIVTGNPDGTFLPEKAVTRAEFAAMITRALAIPESALAGYTSTTFKDTTGYGWAVPYLAFAQSKGIMLGDGAGNVMPGRTITVNEAMTMALRAIGYTANSAMLVGVWPANYVSIAQNEDLYDDVASNSTVNKASAAQIIYNLLTVQKVAVNTDGETTFLEKSKDVAANLLNTNLGCSEYEDVILGVNYKYDNSLINITAKLGAFGTAYVNKDKDLVAFVADSTALTGKVDGDKFKVGDDKYDLPGTVTIAALIANADVDASNAYGAAKTTIANFADTNADGGKNVTINVDLSGKRIKEVYTVVAWQADVDTLASSDVQEDVKDQELEGLDFPLTDDDEIDYKAFQLVGVSSLADIKEDHVLYVYADNDDSKTIRKVAVGTETLEGTVTEAGDDYVTVAGKDYKFSNIAEVKAEDFDGESEGTFYLDFEGKVYDFDGVGKADTFAIVKASYSASDSYNPSKIRLYLSDDSTKTIDFAEDKLADVTLVTRSGMDLTDVAATLNTTGAVIGYSLNADGDIKTVDASAHLEKNVSITSTKVIRDTDAAKSYTLASNAVVFTYDTSKGTIRTSEYDISAAADLKANKSGVSSYILNKDDKVVALIVPDTSVDKKSDDVYGVLNTWGRTTSGGDNVYRLAGFIDGSSFSKLTKDATAAKFEFDKAFTVYAITVDTSDVIKDIKDLNDDAVKIEGVAGVTKGVSGFIAKDVEITTLSSDKTVINGSLTLDDDAVVYEYKVADKKFVQSSISRLKKGIIVNAYDTKGEDADGIATVVIFKEK